MICRCETITEGEILEAMKGLIPPGRWMGSSAGSTPAWAAAQGGFCGPRVVEILARELNLTPQQIQQDQKGTWLLWGETKGGSANV